MRIICDLKIKIDQLTIAKKRIVSVKWSLCNLKIKLVNEGLFDKQKRR
jgi:hypothetical protein